MAETRFQKTPLHFVQYMGLKAVCVLLRLLPYKAAVSLCGNLTGVSRFLLPKRFALVQKNIHLAFPDKSEEEVRQIALASWRNMGVILAEFVKLSHCTPEEFKKHCTIDGIEKLRRAQGTTGGIIHIGHFTNWEAFGLAASVYNMDKAVLAQRVDNPYVDAETNRLRNIFSGKTFYSNHEDKPFFACMRWIKRKKIIGILFDQNVVSGEIWLPFMGRICAWSPITALLAIKLQAPVFPVLVHREKSGKLVCKVFDAVYPPTQFSMANVRQFTKQLVQIYEDWLREDPSTWLWAHNRWKRQAEGEAYLKEHPEEAL